jgi:hypothetical protein
MITGLNNLIMTQIEEDHMNFIFSNILINPDVPKYIKLMAESFREMLKHNDDKLREKTKSTKESTKPPRPQPSKVREPEPMVEEPTIEESRVKVDELGNHIVTNKPYGKIVHQKDGILTLYTNGNKGLQIGCLSPHDKTGVLSFSKQKAEMYNDCFQINEDVFNYIPDHAGTMLNYFMTNGRYEISKDTASKNSRTSENPHTGEITRSIDVRAFTKL